MLVTQTTRLKENFIRTKEVSLKSEILKKNIKVKLYC